MPSSTGLHLIPEDVASEIQRRLSAVEREEGVRILFAVESGSRAWGFPSPDSDFDVRFVYARPRDWYLSITPGRDVIELPIEGLYDINGWDLRKALQLLLKPNPVLLEWMASPIFYRRDETALFGMKALADKTLHQVPMTYHYVGLAETQWHGYFRDRNSVSLKKYLYALRPALALRWLHERKGERPPMDLPSLRAGLSLPRELSSAIDDLLVRKQQSKELGTGPREPELDAFIDAELTKARARRDGDRMDVPDLTEEMNAFFRATVG